MLAPAAEASGMRVSALVVLSVLGAAAAQQHARHFPKEAATRTDGFVHASDGPNSFPDLIGVDGASAIAQIRERRPDLSTVVAVREGSMVTQDVRRDRVRVFVDGDGAVVRTPRVG